MIYLVVLDRFPCKTIITGNFPHDRKQKFGIHCSTQTYFRSVLRRIYFEYFKDLSVAAAAFI